MSEGVQSKFHRERGEEKKCELGDMMWELRNRAKEKSNERKNLCLASFNITEVRY